MAFIYIQYYCVTGKHISYVIMRVCYHHRVHMTPWASLWQEEWAAPMGTYLFLSPPWMPTDRLPKHSNYRWGAYDEHMPACVPIVVITCVRYIVGTNLSLSPHGL